MTRVDTAKLVVVLVAAYPNYDKFKDPQHIEAVVDLWADMFDDVPAQLVGFALKRHIATSKWPPSVAELRAIITDIQHPDLLPPDMAWAAVSDLMDYAGPHYYGDLYSQLPPLVARAVEVIGYTALYALMREAYVGGKAGLDRVAFTEQYTPMYERAKQAAMTPRAVVQGITDVQAQLPQCGQLVAALKTARHKQHDVESLLAQQPSEAIILDGD